MKKIILEFLDYRLGDHKIVSHETLEEVYYLARNDSFNAVIDKNNKKFYVNKKVFDVFNEMFNLDMDESKNYISDWVELRFGIKDCSIRNVYRNSW